MMSNSSILKTVHAQVDGLGGDSRETQTLHSIVTAVEASYKPFSHLLGRMKPDLLAERWSHLVIDNRRARLPGMVVLDITRRLAESHNLQVPTPFHLAASLAATAEDMRYQLINAPCPEWGRDLFFTEYMARGLALQNFARATESSDRPFDAAALTCFRNPWLYKIQFAKELRKTGMKIYTGERSPNPAYHHHALSNMTGVEVCRDSDGRIQLVETDVPPNPKQVLTCALGALSNVLYNEHFES